jgi:hypothetical protein
MKRVNAFVCLAAMTVFSSCSKQEGTAGPAPAAETPSASAPVEAAPTPGPRAVVHLKDGKREAGTIVASSKTDMIVAGDDGIERKIPLGQVKSVDYGDAMTTAPAGRSVAAPRAAAPASRAAAPAKTTAPEPTTADADRPLSPAAPAPAAPARAAVTTRTFELPSGSQISVRTNEAINSETATQGQTFDAQVTRDAKDANGDIVIPRGSNARVVIRSASRGGRINGASDLVLDLQSVTINGRPHTLDTVDVTKEGKSGVGANRRTAEYAGGGAALGAIVGAIAGGGKGAAIGAGAGAGAGALAQILTKGRAINVPVESVLTFSLDKPLKVARAE